MNKQRNKANLPHISIAEQTNAMPASALSPVQPKAAPAQQPIHDLPHQDPIAASDPTHSEIAVRAHEIYVKEGRPQGQSDEIWRRAELEKRYHGLAALRTKTRG